MKTLLESFLYKLPQIYFYCLTQYHIAIPILFNNVEAFLFDIKHNEHFVHVTFNSNSYIICRLFLCQ